MFVRLTMFHYGALPIYVNPALVASVLPYESTRDGRGTREACTELTIAGAGPESAGLVVQELPDEVVARLSSGQFDLPAAPAKAALAAVDPPVGSVYTMDERRAIGEAFAHDAMRSSDFELHMDLCGLSPWHPEWPMLPRSVVEKACAHYLHVAETHPEAATRDSFARRANEWAAAVGSPVAGRAP